MKRFAARRSLSQTNDFFRDGDSAARLGVANRVVKQIGNNALNQQAVGVHVC